MQLFRFIFVKELKCCIFVLFARLLAWICISNGFSKCYYVPTAILIFLFLMVDQGSSAGGDGFEVSKYGHGRVALIGFPRLAI